MNPKVDAYLLDGCGRCELYGTLQCKVHKWPEELNQLRRIVLGCGLEEELKWSQPCYTLNGNNVLLLTAFKEYAALAFFKGALLKDIHLMLVSPGENSQAVRQLRFTDVAEILKKEDIIKSYILQAIEVEKAGLKVEFKKESELHYPDELVQKMDEDPVYKAAFEALTPGRRRSYVLHFSAAKQSATRVSRIEKCASKIFEGKGWNER